jgi:UMP-CMP kinase
VVRAPVSPPFLFFYFHFLLPPNQPLLAFIGKGTQCSLLAETFNFCHLSAGELLRDEKERPDSQFGDLIRTAFREGNIVPMEVTIKLLENAMHAALETKTGEGWGNGKGRFLIDGFPRKMDQALKFEEDVGIHLFLYSSDDVLFWSHGDRCARHHW